MASWVISMPPYTRMMAEKANATSSPRMLSSFCTRGLHFSTRMGMFMWPRSPVTREAPSRLAQANR